MKLTKIDLPPITYSYIFKDQIGNIFKVACTKENYEALAIPNVVNPVIENCTFLGAKSEYIIPVNCYADDTDGKRKLVNINGTNTQLENDDIALNGTISQKGLNDVQKVEDFLLSFSGDIWV